jgi:hypothetical protein
MAKWKKGESGNDGAKFKKGQSGNPNGRPKGVQNSRTRLMRWLSEEIDIKNPATKKLERATILEMMDAKLIQTVISGDKNMVSAYREILDRLEGKAEANHNLNHTGDVTINVNPADDCDPIEPGQES